MYIKKLLFIIAYFAICNVAISQTIYDNPHSSFNAQHYQFDIAINDKNDNIAVTALVTLLCNKAAQECSLDLDEKSDKKGMQVTAVTCDGKVLSYKQLNDKLYIQLEKKANVGDKFILQITYNGIPANGLIISTNKHGDRTFFGDNWPNRAHFWLPVIDHPSDKATVEWYVTAPNRYKVIGNGKLLKEENIANNQRLTVWKETIPIPTKVMVIGAARFAIQQLRAKSGLEVESWLYPQDSVAGFFDYSEAPRVLDFFESKIAPFPYEKLANVQSKTMFGGMENASCIFYSENAIYGFPIADMSSLLAHEIAHQWFGNSATEQDFSHIWLSEGFATYLSALYMLEAYGDEAFYKEMLENRATAIGFSKSNPKLPVIDHQEGDLMNLLNPNSYQKGAWVLHMLHNEIGDAAFWKTVQQYYATYKNANAYTEDLQRIAEQVSGKNLSRFFNQWLRQGSNPKLNVSWKYDEKSKKCCVMIRQTQSRKQKFRFPLDIALLDANGQILHAATYQMEGRKLKISIPMEQVPSKIRLDPNNNLLFENDGK